MTDGKIAGRYGLSDAIIRQSERIGGPGPAAGKRDDTSQGPSFRELLEQESLTFSKHATQRSQERNISVSKADLGRLQAACDKARTKGIRDALIVMDDSAYIINAPSKTVITVIGRSEMKENVISNIDGALFI